MPELWPQLPPHWERYQLLLDLDEVLQYSGWNYPNCHTNVSEGVSFILDSELNLSRASSKHEVKCSRSGETYCLFAGFAGGIETGNPFCYPRVHLVPTYMMVGQLEDRFCLLVSLSGHIDDQPHKTDYSWDAYEKSERVLRSLHYWSRCRYLGLELPPVRNVAELLGFDPPTTKGSS